MLKLRQIEVKTAYGKGLAFSCIEAEISEESYFRRRKKSRGLEVDQARKKKDIEHENQRLRWLVTDLLLEKQVLADVASGPKGQPQRNL